MEPTRSRARLMLAIFVLWLALSTGVVWAAGRWSRPRQARFDLPVAPGRALHVHAAGAPVRHYIEPGPSPIVRPGSTLQVAVWYRSQGARPGKHLATLPLPAWPLAALTIGMSLVLLGVTKRRKASGRRIEQRL